MKRQKEICEHFVMQYTSHEYFRISRKIKRYENVVKTEHTFDSKYRISRKFHYCASSEVLDDTFSSTKICSQF